MSQNLYATSLSFLCFPDVPKVTLPSGIAKQQLMPFKSETPVVNKSGSRNPIFFNGIFCGSENGSEEIRNLMKMRQIPCQISRDS